VKDLPKVPTWRLVGSNQRPSAPKPPRTTKAPPCLLVSNGDLGYNYPDGETFSVCHQLPQVKVRGLHLASLFMSGVEHAIFVNDAVGAPVPWGVTCPWLFFDGKLFHMKLLKASTNVSLLDLCDGYVSVFTTLSFHNVSSQPYHLVMHMSYGNIFVIL